MRLVGRVPEARLATLATLRDPRTNETLDRSLVLWFPGPRSFTGEDMAELHLHGGRAVTAAVLDALGAVPGLRPAAAGEFTKRAFRNGKLDLTAVEGLADLIHAETEAQRRQALQALEGGLRQKAEGWRDALLRMAAHVEAELDFSDEDDVPDDVGRSALASGPAVLAGIRAAIADADRGERVREGFTVVLAGPPNAGKSSLLNALARRDVAIVSPEAGTTRDLIEVHLDLGGFPVVLVDTAGLREAEGAVEQEGVRRALDRAGRADLVLWLSPVDEPVERPDFGDVPVWTLASKADLGGTGRGEGVSVRDEAMLAGLVEKIRGEVQDRLAGETAVTARLRQRLLLMKTAEALEHALGAPPHHPLELLAEDIRVALARLGELTGRVDVEQLLDVVFAEFCIGK